MLAHQRNNLVVCRLCSAVGIVRAKVQAVNLVVCLAKWACSFTAARDKLPYKGLCRNPLLIIASCKVTAVALIPVEQGKPDCLFLIGRKGVPSVRRCLFQGVACFQRYTRLNTKGVFSVHKHTVLIVSRAACGMTVKGGTRIVPHSIAAAVVGVAKGNRTNVTRCKRRRCRQNRQCRDRSHKSSRSFFE